MKNLPEVFNIFNPPAEIAPGQVYSADGLKLLVTRVITEENLKVVRVLVLTDVLEAGNEDDVILEPASHLKGVFRVPKLAWRITEGPVPASKLKYYRGSVSEEGLKLVLASLKKPVQYIDEITGQYLEYLGKRLDPLRHEAVSEIEENLADQEIREAELPVFRLPLNIFSEVAEPGVVYRMGRAAAADVNNNFDIIEFFRKDSEAPKVILLENDETFISVSLIDSFFYLVVYSDKVKDCTLLLINGAETGADPDYTISLTDGRGFIPFKDGLKTDQINALQLVLDDQDFECEFLLKAVNEQ